MKKIIYYLPRIITVLIVAFFAMFIFEGFSPEFKWQDSMFHLITALIVLAITIMAWKLPKVGGVVFVVLGLFLCFFIHPLLWNGIIIGGATLITGFLFLINK